MTRWLSCLLFPPRCISCRTILARDILDVCESPLCYRCRVAWEREKGARCPECGLELSLCRCSSPLLKKVSVSEAVKLIAYRADRETAGRRSILALKKELNASALQFFASQLRHPLERHMEENGIRPEDVVLCYIPRGRRNKAAYGFDQSEQLARRLADACGLTFSPLLYRIGHGEKEQKKLSATARVVNSGQRFAVDELHWEAVRQSCRWIFLLDDVITTGASMSAGVSALRPYFDGKITAVSLARTVEVKKRKRFEGSL